MAETGFTPVQLCAIRVSELTAAGAPLTGANRAFASEAAISLEVDVELEDGADLTQKNGCGRICAALKEPDRIKRLTFALELCQLDFDLLNTLTGSDTISSGGAAVGFQYPAVQSPPDAVVNGVCLEGWTKLQSGDEPAVPTITSPDAAYLHWVFPRTKWVQDKITMEDELMVIPLNGQGEENSHITANGPFDDWPAFVAAHGGITRIGGAFYDSDLPAAFGNVTVSSIAS